MRLVYLFSVSLYFLLLRLSAIFNARAMNWVTGRKGLFIDLKKWRQEHSGSVIWFHCASLGEFEMAGPLMGKLKAQGKSENLLVTFYSPSGFGVKVHDPLPDGVFYLPADGLLNPQKFLNIIKPEIIFFVKYEFWLGYLWEIKKSEIPCYLVNGSFRNDQIFFRWYGSIFRKALLTFKTIFVQYPASETLLKAWGIKNVVTTGDIRFDRVAQLAAEKKSLPFLNTFIGNHLTLVGGSTWPLEEQLLLRAILQLTDINLIIAPHDVSVSHISEIEKMFSGFNTLRYSQANDSNTLEADVLIIDSIGKLSSVYAYADFALIGGGFTGALHNILEASVHGVPVFFGPLTVKFPEADFFVGNGLAFHILKSSDLVKQIKQWQSKPEQLKSLKVKGKQLTSELKGAAAKIVEEIYS
jgi:3-deoxy-D-manno-octulosonic-acid transferase